jgi:hypothetical protein
MEFTLTEIKKHLYKEKPTAYKFAVGTEFTTFDCTLQFLVSKDIQVFFKIPNKDASGFNHSEPAQLLIRWYSHYITL